MSEQDIGPMPLYVCPFVLRHHQRVLAAGKYLSHGFAVGICHRRFRPVAVAAFGDKLPADVDAYLVNCLVVYLLHMKVVNDGDRSQVTSLTLRFNDLSIAPTKTAIISSLFVPGMAAPRVPRPPCPSLLVRNVHISPLFRQVSSRFIYGPIFAALK